MTKNSRSASSGARSGKGAARTGKVTSMTTRAASRIQSKGDRQPSSRTAATGFAPRAQSAAARHSNSTR